MLILSLGRNGGLPLYFKSIYQKMTIKSFSFISKYSDYKIKGARELPTYRNKYEFLLNSILILPIFIVYLIWLVKKNNIKYLYIPYFHYWIYPIMKVLKITTEINITFTVHDAINHYGDENKIESKLLSLCICEADKLIFLTDHVKKEAVSCYKINTHSNIIPHGLFNLPKLKEKTKCGSSKFLFLGRVSKYKGVELLLDTWSKSESLNNNCSLTIAGKSNYDINYDSYRVKKIDVIDKFLTDDEMAELLNTHDVIVLPYLEATQSGIITFGITSLSLIVTTRVGGLSEQINESCGYFCEPNRVSLENTLEQLLNDEELRIKKFNNLKEHKINLSWKKIARDIECYVQR